MNRKRPPGPPMTLGNVRKLGVRNLLASWLNDACQHTALIDVSSYPADIPGTVVSHCSCASRDLIGGL
jgi:hypothetical protein